LNFHGHPPKPVTLQGAHKYMGCATQREADTLVFATYGEWSTKEGLAELKLVFIVPKTLDVEQRTGLSGPNSVAAGNEDGAGRDGKYGYWYAATSPAQGWTAVPDVSDLDRTAK